MSSSDATLAAMSIQDLRQSLRERGANCRGSKKQLMQRMSELFGFSAGNAAPAAAKVRVTVQKSRHEAAAVLLDPTLSPEHLLAALLDKAANKWRFKPTRVYVIASATAGGGTELTSENLREFLQDGLVVLTSSLSKIGRDMLPAGGPLSSSPPPVPAEELAGEIPHADSSSEALYNPIVASASSASASKEPSTNQSSHLTDSGSCSSEVELDDDGGRDERASIRSFGADSDSLYSFSAAPSSARRGKSVSSDYDEHKEQAASRPRESYAAHTSGNQAKAKGGWRSMLPKTTDQPGSGQKPPMYPSPVLRPAMSPPPPAIPAATAVHAHRNHRCSASAAATTAAPLPSLMDEILAPAACVCCDAGCEIDFAAPSAASSPTPALSQNTLLRSYSTPSAAAPSSSSPLPSAAPAASPSLTHSQSQSSSFSVEGLRCAELEKSNRRLDASLRSYLRSDLELRARVTQLESGANTLPALESEYSKAVLQLGVRDKELAKAIWERDRLKEKGRALMAKNNELKTDADALVELRNEHALLQTQHARLSGQQVNERTPPAVLQDLLLQHTQAIQRVHQQMSLNVLREKKALEEARQCKVCMARPADTILLPCSHFALCAHCASGLVKCPLCRAVVQNRLPVYL